MLDDPLYFEKPIDPIRRQSLVPHLMKKTNSTSKSSL